MLKQQGFKRIGVLGNSALYTFDEKYFPVRMPTASIIGLDMAVELCHKHRIEVLYIAPGSYASQCAVISNWHENDRYAVRTNQRHNGMLTWCNAWRKKGDYSERAAVMFHFFEHDPRWPFRELTNEMDLLHCIAYLRSALNADIMYSPGRVGMELMKKSLKHKAWAVSGDYSALPGENARDIRYHTDVISTCYVETDLYLHVWDKNSAYLGACTSVCLPVGKPILNRALTPETVKWPGVYEVELARPVWHYPQGIQWLWQPEVDFLRTAAEEAVSVIQGWQWAESHTALRPWAESMWKAQIAFGINEYRFPLAASAALKACKRIRTQAVGWLKIEGENDWFHPDWWNLIVSKSAANMLWKAHSLANHGYDVVYIDVDSIGIISPYALPREACGLMYEREGMLGGFKEAYTLRLSESLTEALSFDHFALKETIATLRGEADE